MSATENPSPAALSFDTWLEPPHHRASFAAVDQVVRCAPIGRGNAPVRAFTPAKDGGALDRLWERAEIAFDDGGPLAMADVLDRTSTDAIMVLVGDTIVLERYFGAHSATTRHIVMSISKSFCGMLAGILVGEGVLDTEADVTAYVPELAGSSFDGATVRQVLDMTAAPDFDMTYMGPDTEVQTGDRCAGWRAGRPGDPAGTREFLAGLRGHGAHGSAFQYCSATTDVLAWVLENASGMPYRRLMEDRLWSRMGAEHDAFVTVDALGTPYACAGMGMRLRDLARFGRMLMNDGVHDGRQVVPAAWIEQTFRGGPFGTGDDDSGVLGTYTNQWWMPADGPQRMYGVGIFGQYLWLAPDSDVVIAKFSGEPGPLSHSDEHLRVFESVTAVCAKWAADGEGAVSAQV